MARVGTRALMPVRSLHTCMKQPRPTFDLSALHRPSSCGSSITSRLAPSFVYRFHSTLKQTALHDFHREHGGKMVPFGGYSMPVQYEDQSITESHKWTREKASLFDVGHMLQHHFSGPDAQKLLEIMTPAGLSSLEKNHSTLSCLLLPETGGIVDDTVITRLGDDSFYVVTNAGCREKDVAFIQSQIEAHSLTNLTWEQLDDHGLLALQGPESVSILNSCLSKPSGESLDLNELYFGQCARSSLTLPSDGHQTPPVLISRGGYTGEDGFEISLPPTATLATARGLLAAAGPGKLRLAGLGARDSLRLEAGMCLYGQDLDETITPGEAALGWVVAKERRDSNSGFNGAEKVLSQLKTPKQGGTGVARRRIGLIVQGAPARTGAKILDPESGEELGVVTSGVPSPTLGKNIAMGYVKNGFHKQGTKLAVEVRGKKREAEVSKMPFIPSKFFRPAVSPA